MAKWTHVTGSMSTQRPFGHSTATVLLWPTTYTYAWLRQPELGPSICLPTPLALG
ncbi:hypothetical protein PR202_gb16945 [Eleusine coracana subsp. coracana]|uniref:Uncharacterized protein n=1 Tax=Eleusine coracana subsp. coracana TaxID=191504 RepID=A0AAV5F1Q0_ELECO|nr:hypothetical protein PR202_gb16945 [Eleusine coracana subsp. coracana]